MRWSGFLEVEFCDELHQARRFSADDVAEVGVFNLPVHRCGTIELGVIKCIEGLSFELEGSRVSQAHILLKRQVEVVDAGPIEDSALGVTQLADVFFGKQSSTEGRSTVASVGIDFERPGEMLRGVE